MSEISSDSKGAIWSIGFRSFFLGSSVFSVLIMVLWLLFQTGHYPITQYSPILWHSHEMVFGFTVAVIGGFLLTSSSNWSGIPALKGKKLQILFFTWLLGRLAFIFSPPNIIASVIDLAFLPILIYFLIPYIGTKEQKKNFQFLILLSVLFIANLITHLDILGFMQGIGMKGIYLALNITILIITVITGRIIPFFTKKAVENASVSVSPLIEKLTLAFSIVFLIIDLFIGSGLVYSISALIAGAFHLIRFIKWNPIQSKSIPILWVLYTGYFWLIAGFFLKGLIYFFPSITQSIASHAWTVGAIGILIFGMITRVSLGHTGRVIHANKITVTAYVLLNLATFARVFLLMIMPSGYLHAILTSGILWIGVFVIFSLQYWKILISPRPDGK